MLIRLENVVLCVFKQVIVIRKDLKMSKGKIAAQVAHASIGAYRKAGRLARKAWEMTGEKKVVLRAKSLEEIMTLKRKADSLKLPNVLIRDAGLTEIEAGTVTALGIGPARGAKIDKVTGSLPLLD